MYHYFSCLLFFATLCFAIDFPPLSPEVKETNETPSRLRKSASLTSNDFYDYVILRHSEYFVRQS